MVKALNCKKDYKRNNIELSETAKEMLELLELYEVDVVKMITDVNEYRYCISTLDDAYLLEAAFVLLSELGITSYAFKAYVAEFTKRLKRSSKIKKEEVLL